MADYEQDALKYLRAIKVDSEFFVEKTKKTNKDFDPDDLMAEVSETQREVRWHTNCVKLSGSLISQIL